MLNRNLKLVVFSLLIILCLSFVNLTATSANPVVLMETSKGNIKIELFEKEAPITVKNFLSYVSEGFYDGLIFHRVIKNFMVQGGGFFPGMKEKKPKSPIKNEATNGKKNDRGTVAMARTGVVDSATAQFFINVVNNDFLNHRNPSPSGYGYAVFGKVVEGMDVVDSIVNVSTGTSGMFRDMPKDIIEIKKATIVDQVKEEESK